MHEIDLNLYETNSFYCGLIDGIRATEEKQRQLQIELDRLKAERDAYYRQQMIGYANQIPYSCMTPLDPYRWVAPYAAMQDNFASYWDRVREQEQIAQRQRAEQLENLRRIFRLAADASALTCKQNAPVPSIVFDGIALLTAGDLLEAAKSAASVVDTAVRLSKKNENR